MFARQAILPLLLLVSVDLIGATPVAKGPVWNPEHPHPPPPPAPAPSLCYMSTILPAFQYAVVLDAHAPGVGTDCGEAYLGALRNHCGVITSWWCQPFDKPGNKVALSDPSAFLVTLTFWTSAFCNAGDVSGAVWDGSNDSVGIPCNEIEGSTIDRPDMPELHFGE